jgi:hypothetical protein
MLARMPAKTACRSGLLSAKSQPESVDVQAKLSKAAQGNETVNPGTDEFDRDP